MQPLHNKVLVKRIAGETTTSSGIVLQRSNEVDKAEVLAIGPQVDEVQVGDIVLLDWNKTIKAGDNYLLTVDNIVLIYGE